MTPLQIKKVFDAYIKLEWTDKSVTPVLTTSNQQPALPYIEPHVLFGGVLGLEINGHAERTGVLAINIFTRKDAGDDEGLAYGGKLEKLFWHKTLTGIVCESGDFMPSTEKIGLDEDRQALHFQTKIPFSLIWEYTS